MWSEQEYRITLGMSNLSDYASCVDRAFAWVFDAYPSARLTSKLKLPWVKLAKVI